jgi:hypothetical protein
MISIDPIKLNDCFSLVIVIYQTLIKILFRKRILVVL